MQQHNLRAPRTSSSDLLKDSVPSTVPNESYNTAGSQNSMPSPMGGPTSTEFQIQDKEKDLSVQLPALPSASDTNCTDFINNLYDYWSKGQNVLMIHGQVKAAHIIHFILAMQPNVSRPFLLMVPSSSISEWKAEFSYVAPSVNTVIYNGNRDARIRTLEFCDGPNVMFTVLLSTLDIITEDLEYIKCIRWEAVIVNECINSDNSAGLIFVKELASGSMILLLLDQINENAIECYNILSLLDHNSDSCDFEGPDSITLLKEKLSRFILCGPKSGPSRLVEYWVPVQMSNVQLELYCSSLLTNSTTLRSKRDPVGLLREILISTRKCCDHPYAVEEKLETRLIQGALPADILEIGVQASGKLYFLDTILTKIKDQGKKVVILFKTLGGSGRDIGHILDDYVHQRFGEDCYERLYAGGVSSRRQASVARFNKEGRFIFLLETRACSSSIKLSSIDAVVIYGSDWNPLNDVKALQKIEIDSKFEVKVFRLYTLCSIEEKVLLLFKKSVFLESNLKGLGFSTSHALLTWGASFLFEKLDEFHDCLGDPKILPQCSFLKDAVQEILSVLQTHWTYMSTKYISSARHNDGPLLGELYSQFKDEDQHCLFWKKLLEGRQTTWIYLAALSSQRNRKRVQFYGETNAHNETVKRQKKKPVEEEPVLACSIDSAQSISPASSPDLCTELKDFPSELTIPVDIAGYPAFQEFDPLQKEYERVCGESNQVTRNHEDTVLHLKSECDKEIERAVDHIQRKYESYQMKIVANMKLAETFRCTFIDNLLPDYQNPADHLQQAQHQQQSGSPSSTQLSVADQNAAYVYPTLSDLITLLNTAEWDCFPQ